MRTKFFKSALKVALLCGAVMALLLARLWYAIACRNQIVARTGIDVQFRVAGSVVHNGDLDVTELDTTGRREEGNQQAARVPRHRISSFRTPTENVPFSYRRAARE